MVGEGGEDMRKRIRNEGGKGKTRREDQYEKTREVEEYRGNATTLRPARSWVPTGR